MTEFIIFFEHRARELESVCLLKEELCRRGYRVRVAAIHSWRTFSTFCFYNPKVLIVPWLYGDEEVAFFNHFSKPPRKIVNMQWEQITTAKYRETGTVYPKGLAKKAFHVCWGEKEKEYLIKAGLQEKRLLLTGSISMDLNRPMFRSLYQTRHELALEYQLDETCSWKLFISSFSLIGGTFIEEKNPDAIKLVNVRKKTRNILLEWFKQYTITHPKSILIYRPHPNEREEPALTALSNEIENFRVISEKSVRQWILCCDTINNWMSTSINDVCFLGKDSSTLRPLQIPQELDIEELVLEKFVTTYEEFEAFNDRKIIEPSDKLVNIVSQFFEMGETPAYIRLADYLEEILKSDCGEDYSQAKGPLDMPLWKHLRRACFVWMHKHMPSIMKMIRNEGQKKMAELVKKESIGLNQDYKKTSKKIRKILEEINS